MSTIDDQIKAAQEELKRLRKQKREEEKRSKPSYCIGCRDNFYNGNNQYGIKECWHLKGAKLVMRKKVPLTQIPPWNQPPVKTLSCHNEDGYVFVDGKRIN